MRKAFVLVLSLSLYAFELCAQQSQVADDQQRFLNVRRSQIDLSSKRTTLKRIQELFELGLVPRTDVDQAKTEVETAQLNYQQAVLALLSLQPRLSIKEAVKYQGRDGRKFVRLTIENLTPTFDDSQFKLLSNFEGADPIPQSLRTRDVQDIFISLRATGEQAEGNEATPARTTIGIPYEVHIPELKYGASHSMEFQLLRNVNSVLVASSYKGQEREILIQLQQAETDNAVTISSIQASQEADLGSEITFSLKLERSSIDVRRFQLKALNLPRQISYSFIDPASQAHLSEVNFPAGVTQQNLNLKLYLPERADEDVPMDKPLEFLALAMDDAQAKQFQAEKIYADSEVGQSRAGRMHLVIVPRGVGKIEASAANLFSEIHTGELVETSLSLSNAGTRRLDNIKVSCESPLHWRVEAIPDIIPALEINREAVIKLRIIPPADAPVGDYEVRLKTESQAYNRQVPSEDKIYRISVKSKANIWGLAGLTGGLLILVVGILVFGVKLTRR
jgi:multidrug efflux pump subunit AcrA (membrane-fusion protein)